MAMNKPARPYYRVNPDKGHFENVMVHHAIWVSDRYCHGVTRNLDWFKDWFNSRQEALIDFRRYGEIGLKRLATIPCPPYTDAQKIWFDDYVEHRYSMGDSDDYFDTEGCWVDTAAKAMAGTTMTVGSHSIDCIIVGISVGGYMFHKQFYRREHWSSRDE